MAGGLQDPSRHKHWAGRAVAALGTWPQAGRTVATITVTERRGMLWPWWMGFLSRGLGWVRDGWETVALLRLHRARCAVWLRGRGEGVERSRRPPWEEERNEATSLGPHEFQAPGLEQLS